MEGRIFKTNIAGKDLVVKTGKYAEFSNGFCMVSCGETSPVVSETYSCVLAVSPLIIRL